MRWLPLLLLGVVACNREPPDSTPPEPLAPRPGPVEQTCEQLASQTPGATWRELKSLGPSGALAVMDPSVLGGPFEAPLRLSFREAPAVRVLVTGAENSETVLCLQLRSQGAPKGERRLLGRVGVDTGMLLLGDEEQLKTRLAPAVALVVPCAEAPAEELAKLQKHLGTAGEQLAAVLPTLACMERPATPEDQTRLANALREIRSEGRFLLEPRSPAWAVLRVLGARSWAWFPDDQAPAGLVVEVKGPDGAYPVIAEANGQQLALVEIPLR